MDTHAEESAEAVPLLPEALPFRMCVVYDGEAALNAADEAADFVLNELGADIAAEKSIWESVLFGLTAARCQAAAEAAEADIILVVLSSPQSSARLRDWTEEWLRRRDERGGLLAVIPTGTSEQAHADMVEFFYETAVSAGLDFICHKHRVL